MVFAQLHAYAKGSWLTLTCSLSSAAFAAIAVASAYAQTTATPAAAVATQLNTSTAQTPAVDGGANLGVPTLRLSGLTLNAGAQASETYTNNVAGVAGGPNSGSAFYTSLGFNFDVHDHTLRFDGDLSYSLNADLYPSQSQYNRISNYLNALANATLIRNQLFLRTSAFTAPILINGLGPLNAAGVNSGLRNTYGYVVSPELTLRLGDFAISNTSASQSAVFFDIPGGVTIGQTVPGLLAPPDSLVSYGGIERISSGPDFYRLNWALNGSAFKTVQSNLTYEEESANALVRYAIDHAFALTALVGYDWFSSNQAFSQSISGLSALGGLQFTPSSHFRANFSAGTQFNSSSYTGDLFWEIGPYTSLIGSLTNGVTTPGGRLIKDLGNLAVNGSGQFYNSTSQLNPATPPSTVSNVTAFNPAPLGGSALTNSLARYRSATVSLLHIDGRTEYRLTGYAATYDTVTPLPTGTRASGNTMEAAFDVSRAFTPRLRGSMSARYIIPSDFGIRYKLFQGVATLNYELSATMQVYFYASYLHRDSQEAIAAVSPASGNLSTVSVSIGVHKQIL